MLGFRLGCGEEEALFAVGDLFGSRDGRAFFLYHLHLRVHGICAWSRYMAF